MQHGTEPLLCFGSLKHTAVRRMRVTVCLRIEAPTARSAAVVFSAPAARARAAIGSNHDGCSKQRAAVAFLIGLPSFLGLSKAMQGHIPTDTRAAALAHAAVWRMAPQRRRTAARSDDGHHPLPTKALPQDFGLFRFASIFNECAMVHSATRSCSDLFTTIKSMNIMLYVRSFSFSKAS